MMDTINWSETGLFGFLVIVVLFFFYLALKSYIEQKSKNYADKKDIAEITEKVEQVKSQYAKTLALINANLSLASKGVETFESEQFKSYIAFHQACSYVLNDISNMDVESFMIKLDFSFSVEKQINIIKESFQPLRKAKANHDLFNDNEQIKEKAEQLYHRCFRYINTLDDLFSDFLIHQTTREHLKEIHKTMTSQTSPDDVKDWSELNKQSKLEFMKAKEEVVKYINGVEFEEARKCNSDYEELLRRYLKIERLQRLNLGMTSS